MADHLSVGEAIVEGDVCVRVKGRLLRVYACGGLWFAQVEFAPTQLAYVPLRAVIVDAADKLVISKS